MSSEIKRHEVNEEWAHTGVIEAGNFVLTSYCVGNIGQPIEAQINGAFDHLTERLASVGLGLESVVKMDCLFRDIWDIPIMEKVIKERFQGKYPVRKSIQTEFAHTGGPDGLKFQLDAIAYRANAEK
jgi:enamine deaminase RidA (YjgF/YER057c/UK114 family)